tara:strand:- start:328 stop:483 length:156 start_codon:yes stop_codon:yes gene_type:complete
MILIVFIQTQIALQDSQVLQPSIFVKLVLFTLVVRLALVVAVVVQTLELNV